MNILAIFKHPALKKFVTFIFIITILLPILIYCLP